MVRLKLRGKLQLANADDESGSRERSAMYV